MAVRAGQILARLDDSTARAMLALAEAEASAARLALGDLKVRLAEAQRTRGRQQMLLEAGAVPRADSQSDER